MAHHPCPRAILNVRLTLLTFVCLLFGAGAAGCSKDFIVDPPHDSPRDPENPDAAAEPAQPGPVVVEEVSANSVTLRWGMTDPASAASYRIYVKGATDTTFYILALYFGSVGVRKTRHAVACGLIADVAGIIAAVFIAYIFFG